MVDDSDLHFERGNGYVIEYWNNDGWAQKSQATRATVSKPAYTYHTLARFDLPAEAHKLEQLRWLLDSVFEAGRAAKAAELRKVLGI